MDLQVLSRCVSRHLRKIVVMNVLLALCLPGWVSAWGQSLPPDLHLESRAPSLAITFAGWNGRQNKFQVKNLTSRAVTGFAVLVVPATVDKVNGRYQCGGRCSATIKVGNAARPLIKPGGAVTLSYDVGTVSSGAIILRSALFSDGTWEGAERSAAFLAALQVGYQAEYDRIVPVLSTIISGGGTDDRARASQTFWQLSGLTVALTPAIIRRFKSGFPDLHDCDHRYARVIKRASVAERRYVVASLRAFIAGRLPAGVSLRLWWVLTTKYLDALGCARCGATPVHPRPLRRAHLPFRGCPVPPVEVVGVYDPGAAADASSDDEFSDDNFLPDVALDPDAEIGPADDLGPDDAPDAEPDEAAHIFVASPPPAPAPTPDVPAVSVHPHPVPKLAPAVAPPAVRRPRPPFPNVAGYNWLFRSISTEADIAVKVGLPDLAMSQPRRAGLTDKEGKIVVQAAEACRPARDKIFAAIIAFNDKYSGEFLWVPRPPEWRSLEMEKDRIVAEQVRFLRKKLGENSFRKLDQYVADDFTPPRSVFHPSPTDLYWRYFHYIAHLDHFALRDRPADLKGGSLRVREQRAAGLNNKQWKVLVKIAKEYDQDVLTKPHVGVRPGLAAGNLPAAPQPSRKALKSQVGDRRVPAAETLPAAPQPSRRAPAPVRPTLAKLGSLAGKSFRMSQANDERTSVSNTYIDQLRSKLGKAAFKRVDAHVQQAYNPFSPVLPAAGKAAAPVAAERHHVQKRKSHRRKAVTRGPNALAGSTKTAREKPGEPKIRTRQ